MADARDRRGIRKDETNAKTFASELSWDRIFSEAFSKVFT
jgi:hypothetical protein